MGYISGEDKLVAMLHLLADNDALDLATIFDIYTYHCTQIMYDVLTQWIIPSNIDRVNMTKYLGNYFSMG